MPIPGTEPTATAGSDEPPPNDALRHPGLPQDERSAPATTARPSNPLDAPTGHPGSPLASVAVTVPIGVGSLGNRREGWYARASRVRREIRAVWRALGGHAPPPLPVTIELHRVGWNRLDPLDGLPSSAKAPLDAIAAWLGVDDRDPRLHLRMSQSVTREMRTARIAPGRLRREANAYLTIRVRPWRAADGRDALRVLGRRP